MTDKVQEELNQILKKHKWKTIDDINWHQAAKDHIISEEFIEEFQDRICWMCISIGRILSEEFMEKNQYKVNWYNISINQTLSEQFIKKHKEKLDIRYLLACNKITQEYLDEPIVPISRFKLLDI